MIWGRLGPVLVLILVLVPGSASCLAARRPEQQKAPFGYLGAERGFAGAGRAEATAN